MPSIIASLALLVLAIGASQVQVNAALVWRHQFEYKLKDNSTASKDAVIKQLLELWAGLPVNGTPIITPQVGSDLGISTTLYSPIPGAVNQVQADLGVRLDFDSLYALAVYFNYTVASPIFASLSDKVANATRIQYLVNNCGYPANGTQVFRHSFEYKFPDTNATHLSDATLFWASAIETAPVTPISYAYGIDLGLGPALYNATNYDFGATFEFTSQANLTAFWAWLFPQTYYQDLVLSTSGATRVQYSTTY